MADGAQASVAYRATVARDMAERGCTPNEIRNVLYNLGSAEALDEAITAYSLYAPVAKPQPEPDLASSILKELARRDRERMEHEAWRVLNDHLQFQDEAIMAATVRRGSGQEPYELDPEGEIKVNTGRAILVSMMNGTVEKWIPLSVLHGSMAIGKVGDVGRVVVQAWWAQRNGIYYKET